MVEPLPSVSIEFRAQEIGLGTYLGSLLAGILDLKSWPDEVEWNLIVTIKETHIHVEPAPEEE